MIIGNAVISNAGNSDCNISVENNTTILREGSIMKEKDAYTACRQLYFIVQLMYIDQQHLSKHYKSYWEIVSQIIRAAPSTSPYIDEISTYILSEKYYQALKAAKNLIDYESKLLDNFLSSSLYSSSTPKHAVLS